MKKIISLLLTMAVMLGSGVSLVYAENVTTWLPASKESETTDFEKSNEMVDTIFALDIMQPNIDGLMELSGKVTRSDAIIWLYRMMNYQNRDDIPRASSSYFSDIGVYHYAAGYVEFMVSNGIVRGYGDGTFRPDDIITYNEIKSLITMAAGYQNTPTVIFNVPITDADKDGMTRKTVAEMFYKLMFTEVMRITDPNEYRFSENEEFIKSVMQFDYFDGILDGVGGVSLYDKDISDNVISVNGTKYYTNIDMTPEYLGYYGRCYIDTNSDDAAVLFYPSSKNDVLEIDCEQIDSYGNGEYSYYNESDKLKRAKLVEGFDCVYNGYYNGDASIMVPEYGTVKLINNNNNSEYDVVIIEDIKSYVVDRIINEKEIVFKNTDENGQNVVIDTEELAECKVYHEDGTETTLSALKSGNVVNVMINGANKAKFIISTNKITGKLSSVSKEDGYMYMTIDDESYKTIPQIYNDVWDGTSLIKMTLLLDVNGRVAGVSVTSVEGWKYGYIIKIVPYNEERDTVILKLLKQDGKIESVICAEKVYLNGEKVENPDSLNEQLHNAYVDFNDFTEVDASGQGKQKNENFTTRLVRYCLNKDGEIFKLDTPVMHSLYEETAPVQDNEDVFAIRSKGNIYYAPEQNMMKFIYKGDSAIGGDMTLGAGGFVFVIPEANNTEPDDDDYYVVNNLNKVGFNQHGEFRYASGYSSNSSSLTCDAIVVRHSGGLDSSNDMMIFDSIYQMYDENECAVVDMVKYISKGQMQEKMLSDDEMSVDASTLRRGDVVVYSVKDDKLLLNKLMYNSAGTGLLNTSNSHPTGAPIYNVSFRVLKGKVGRTDGNTIHLKMEDNNLFDEILKASSITIYDVSTGTKNAKFKCTPAELRTIEKNGGDADTIIVSSKLGYIKDVVVVRY